LPRKKKRTGYKGRTTAKTCSGTTSLGSEPDRRVFREKKRETIDLLAHPVYYFFAGTIGLAGTCGPE